jgi:hypothetical protein
MGRDPVRLESVMEDRWFSVDEIAAYLGIKRDTVYKWIFVRRGKRRRSPLCLKTNWRLRRR